MIVRLSAVGDTILSLPILCALRRKYPEAKIAWVVGKGAADLLVGHEDLDELFVLSKEDIASPKAYWRFLNSSVDGAQIRLSKRKVLPKARGLLATLGLSNASDFKSRNSRGESSAPG